MDFSRKLAQVDLEDLLFHPLYTTKPFKLAQISLGSLETRSRRSICPSFYAQQSLLCCRRFSRGAGKMDLEDPFFHPALLDNSFYDRACLPKALREDDLKNHVFGGLAWPAPRRKMDLQDLFFCEVQSSQTIQASTFASYPIYFSWKVLVSLVRVAWTSDKNGSCRSIFLRGSGQPNLLNK